MRETLVKICGLRSYEAARIAVEAGAAFIGFVFVPSSRRYIAPEEAARIINALPPSSAKTVGVFVDAPPEEVNRIAEICRLDFVQLHGREDAAYAAKISRLLIKAYRYGDDFSVEEANGFPAAYILLDSFSQGQAGGTGKTFAWRQAAIETRRLTKPLILAGGLNADNVATAVEIFHPFAVDVSGGVEENGRKSPDKIKEFLQSIRRIHDA